MGSSNSPDANPDCQVLWDRALGSPKGIRIRCSTKAQASELRFRLYATRQNHKRLSMRLYSPTDPMFGKTSWDGMNVRVCLKDGAYFTEIGQRRIDETLIEEIE